MKKFLHTALLFLFLLTTFNATSQVAFSSFAAAEATIYLDFDGEAVDCPLWNNSANFTCAPAALTNEQKLEIFNRVAEDYRPFNINITTDEKVFLAAPLNKRMRVIVTPTSGWFTGVGGIAFVGSFSWGDDTPCFVFSDRLGNSTKMIAECCSHESGHTVGLSHQSKYDGVCNLTATYNEGLGSGEVSWAPIMGNSYYRNMSGWNNGPTPYGCSNVQDNLSIITTQNGFTYRKDDYADNIVNAAVLNTTDFNADGIISTNTDKDAFKFSVQQNGRIKLSVSPFSVGDSSTGADLDVRVTLFNADKQVIDVYDPGSSMSVLMDTSFNEGTYYIVVDGAGNSNASSYGSLGSYKLTGQSFFVPSCKANLSGSTKNTKHELAWTIECNESIKTIEVESSSDGSIFNTVQSLANTAVNFSSEPSSKSDLYYRLKIITRSERTSFSNIINLKAIERLSATGFKVSTFTRDYISVQAGVSFQYRVSDMNGNTMAAGAGKEGANAISFVNGVPGLYILQLFNGQQKNTMKIIKQ